MSCGKTQNDLILPTDDVIRERKRKVGHRAWEMATSSRYVLSYMLFMGIVLVYALRANFTVALVAITAEDSAKKESVSKDICPSNEYQNSSNAKASGEFDWSEKEKSLLLGGIYYGYTLTQIPAGIFVTKSGGKHLFGLGVLLTAVLSIVLPVSANFGFECVFVVRFMQGVTQSVVFPAMNHLMGLWVPKSETSFFATFVTSGVAIGTVLMQPVAGYVTTLEFLDGWPLAFYIPGALTILWYLGWLCLVYESPADHPRISEKEKALIKSGIASDNCGESKIPWCDIMRSAPFYAFVAAHFCCHFLFYGLLSYLPQYLSSVLNYNVFSSGALSSLPWLSLMFSMQISSILTDIFRAKFGRTTLARKFNQLIGTILPAIFLVLVGYAGCNSTVAVLCIVMSMFSFGPTYSGFHCNNLDLSPTYAGILFAISNTIGTTTGFIAPAVVQAIVGKNIQSVALWRIVFYVFGAVGLSGSIVFTIFGSGNVQKWDGCGSLEEKENLNSNENEKQPQIFTVENRRLYSYDAINS